MGRLAQPRAPRDGWERGRLHWSIAYSVLPAISGQLGFATACPLMASITLTLACSTQPVRSTRRDVEILTLVGVPLRAMRLLRLMINGAMSVLSHHVVHVVLMGAEEEVVNVDAGRVIASVQDVQAYRDRPILYLPLHAVCPH